MWNNSFKNSEGVELRGKFRLPCLAPLGHLTADKREIKDSLKLPSATSFICKPLSSSPIPHHKQLIQIEAK
jgi:hypothetical protein